MSKPWNRKQWIISSIRRMSYRYPPRWQASNRARVARGVYECYVCHQHFRKKDTEMDHKNPVVSTKGFINWDEYIERMLPEENGWGRICIPCHEKKTKKENEERREIKALAKPKKKNKS